VESRSVIHALALLVTLFSCLIFPTVPPSRAEDRALEQLLEVFQKKGVLTAEEVMMIQQTMDQDIEKMTQREKEIEAKEKALNQREKSLQIKEDVLSKSASSKAISPPVDDAVEQTETASDEGESAGSVLTGRYRDGLCWSTQDPDIFSLCLGGLLQTDYRYFNYSGVDPNKNGFDIRRARLLLAGHFLKHFDYKLEYEFQGAESRNLLDAYLDTNFSSYFTLRAGQFKEPFGLEQYTPDKNLFFVNRSMGFYLTPGRDIGLMARTSLLRDTIDFYLGIFNGDGQDGSTGGDEDAPQVTGRLVLSPFKNHGPAAFNDLMFGGSFNYGKIDSNNVDIHVKTTGLTPFFDVASNAKFNIIQDADTLMRYGMELGWAFGPLALMSEYVHADYKDVVTSADRFDIELEDYYVALLWMLTGEKPAFRKGIFQPINPLKSIWSGGWGGLGLAFRYDHWEAGDDVYDTLIQPGISVRKADAYTIALNWWLNSFLRLIADFTRTDFDRPLLIDRDPRTGEAFYSDTEDVFTARLQFAF
jgi:phosphate-selective porin OprO and OprP